VHSSNFVGHKPYKEYRVKPFPDPESKLETTWLTEKEIDLVALKPSKYWIESGTGTLGKVYIEILQCDRLPNLDYSIQGRDKTDSFACIVFEDSAVNTDVITDSLSPRWMPWCQRAFVFNIMHPSSQLMVGLFDHDSGITGPSHQFVGRVVVNLCNRRAQSLYTETYVLHDSALDGRETRGTVTLRIRLEIPDGRKALVAGAVPTFNHDVSVAEREYFTVVHKTITQGVCHHHWLYVVNHFSRLAFSHFSLSKTKGTIKFATVENNHGSRSGVAVLP